jgi:hypothetical protein
MVDFETVHASNSRGQPNANEQAMPEDTTPPNDPAHQKDAAAQRLLTDPDYQKRIKDPILTYLGHIKEGLERANALIAVADGLTDQSRAQDVLRAVVVLNHAYLEDALRTLASQLLPEAGEEALNEIPLASSGSVAHAQKFHLGKLVQHKGKTVDGVIRESITQHLDRATYNDTTQISQQLDTLGFKIEDHNTYFPTIQQMMQRRHQIVHRGDRAKATDSDTYAPQPVDRQQVVTWLHATTSFVQSLVHPLVRKLISIHQRLTKS